MTQERVIHLVRHGETDWNQSGRIQGHRDPPLNDIGRAQARLVSHRLAQLGPAALYSSDLQRAYETAQIIGAALGSRVIQKPSLREINFGIWQGWTSQEIRQRDPQGYAARRASPYDVTPEGGETWRCFYARAVLAVHEILASTDAKCIVVVAHSGICTVLGLRALGLDCTGKRTFGNDNCAIHTIAITGNDWRAVMLNDAAHLNL
jgi:broad specificity phosphatase PhoE